MNDREILDRADRAARSVVGPDDPYEDLLRRRDRKRRNQRIAAGVVGIAAFVAAVWIVTSVSSLDRSETSVVPGRNVTGPAVIGPIECPGCQAGPVRPKTASIGTVTRSGTGCALEMAVEPIPPGPGKLKVINDTNRVTSFDLFYLAPDATFEHLQEFVSRGELYGGVNDLPPGTVVLTEREVGPGASAAIIDNFTSGDTYAVVCAHPLHGIDIFRNAKRPIAIVGPINRIHEPSSR